MKKMKISCSRYTLICFLTSYSLISSSLSQNFTAFRLCLVGRNFSSNLIFRRSNSTEYNYLNYQFGLNPAQIYPRGYVLPWRERDVTAIVRCGRQNNIRVTARSGGHQFEKFAYGNKDSVVIDLRLLNVVNVNSDMTASIGGGTILGPMSYKLWKNGRVFFPIGLCPMVGIGGLAPSGGHGYFARNYGLTTDYILEANIVTASGSLLKVNNSTNTDLYWALRGGGAASFGIITKFVMKVLKPPQQIFEGILRFKLNSFAQVFDKWQRLLINLPRKITPNVSIRNTGIELHFFDCSGTSKAFRRIEIRFPSPRNRTTSTYTYPNFVLYTSQNYGGTLKPGIPINTYSDFENLQPGSSNMSHTKVRSFFASKILNRRQVTRFHDLIRAMPPAVRCRLEAYGGAVNDVKPSATAFVHRRRISFNVRATVDYGQISDAWSNRTAKLWLRRFFNFGLNVFDSRENYQNYPDADMDNYLERYYGENLSRLIRVKTEYDPDNYFNHPQSIPARSPVQELSSQEPWLNINAQWK